MINSSPSVSSESINFWPGIDETEFHLEKERDLLSGRSYYSFEQDDIVQSSDKPQQSVMKSEQTSSEKGEVALVNDFLCASGLLPSLDLTGFLTSDEIAELQNTAHLIQCTDPAVLLDDLDLSGVFDEMPSGANIQKEKNFTSKDEVWADLFPETEEGQEELILVGSLIDYDDAPDVVPFNDVSSWFSNFSGDDDELQDVPSWADQNVIDTDVAVTREYRAWQIAADIGEKYELEKDEIDELTEIFVEHGISACRVAVERELSSGTTVEELILADAVKNIWEEYPEFYDDFSTNYRTMSWPLALALVRSFEGYPDIEEIEQLLVRLFEHWRSDKVARMRTASFGEYLYEKFRNFEEKCEMVIEWKNNEANYVDPHFFLPPCIDDIPPIVNAVQPSAWLNDVRRYDNY